MTSKTQRLLLLLALLIVSSGVVEFTSFKISRPAGDFTFLAVSVVLAICAARTGMIAKTWPIAMLMAGAISLLLLVLNVVFIDFIRNAYLDLGENFGQSAMYGFVVVFVVFPLTLFSAIGAGVLTLVRKGGS